MLHLRNETLVIMFLNFSSGLFYYGDTFKNSELGSDLYIEFLLNSIN